MEGWLLPLDRRTYLRLAGCQTGHSTRPSRGPVLFQIGGGCRSGPLWLGKAGSVWKGRVGLGRTCLVGNSHVQALGPLPDVVQVIRCWHRQGCVWCVALPGQPRLQTTQPRRTVLASVTQRQSFQCFESEFVNAIPAVPTPTMYDDDVSTLLDAHGRKPLFWIGSPAVIGSVNALRPTLEASIDA